MTLIEALVVVALTVLVSALAFPALERTTAGLAAAEARVLLVSDIRVAQAEARRTGRATQLSVRPDGRGYAASGVRRSLPEGVRVFAEGGQPLVFQPDGSAAARPLRMAFGTGTVRIAVDPAIGIVSVGPAR